MAQPSGPQAASVDAPVAGDSICEGSRSARVPRGADGLRVRLGPERGRPARRSRARPLRPPRSPSRTSTPGIPRSAGAAAGRRAAARRDFGEWTMERRVELALAVERAARERDPLITNVEDTVYSDSEARVALANSNGFCRLVRARRSATPTHTRSPGEGADRMTGMGVGGRARPGRARPRADRPRGRRPRARAARRAAADEPPLSRSCSIPTSPRASRR